MHESDTEAMDTGVVRRMPDTLANKIAAGEVVQRPSSVAKELVENSLDAGASQIDVFLRDAGRTLIQVVDDGCGMNPGDATLCFERHATSKLKEAEDLERIRTLGFRGEALASIAAVSTIELRTRTREADVATRVTMEGGLNQKVEPIGAPVGTSLAVQRLFFNVPARRRFLKSHATELKHIVECVQVLALAHPGVGFSVSHDGKEMMRLHPAEGSREEAARQRVADLFGHNGDGDLVPVGESTSYLSLRGWIGRPEIARRSKGEQFLFVNGRPVKSAYLEHAIFGVYRGLMQDGHYPFFLLFLDVDPRHVDVNVHPAKSEVKFDDQRGVYAMLRAVIGKTLGASSGSPTYEHNLPDLLTALSPEEASSADRSTTPSYEFDRPRYGDNAGGVSETLYRWESGDQDARIPSDSHRGETASDAEPDQLLWQIRDAYIVSPIRSGLLVVDQEAAHERVLYEKALASLSGGMGLAQQLLFPVTVDLSPARFALLERLLPDLRSLGFDLQPMSGRTVMIRGVPADIRTGDERGVLDQVIEQFELFQRELNVSERETLARSVARRSAVRSGTHMAPKEMRALIDQLFQCEEPYSTPGGRSTILRIPVDELDRRFGRRR